jgi:hypothetical protein
MDANREELSGERLKGLDERVLSTLLGLPGRIAFSGLRRVLRAHPESLSRALRRLEREGRVEKSRDGYRAVGYDERHLSHEPSDLRPIAQVDLPPGTDSNSVLGRLSGRWFGSLRWVGVVERPTGRLFAWARRDGTDTVLLGIHRGVLRVYVREYGPGDDEMETEDSAYELLTHAVDALRTPASGPSDSVSFLAQDWATPGTFLDN